MARAPCRPMAMPKAVILAGGMGTRISDETSARPKPMIEVGGPPILWHIMKGYSAHGVARTTTFSPSSRLAPPS